MVKIAIAGGAGNVAQEIIEVLLSTGKHDVLIFTRRDIPTKTPNRVTYAKTDYQDPEELAKYLQGTEVVLSFISPHLDQAEAILCQKNLIDASLTAGVKRFAPSEWATSKKLDSMDWYAYKAAARDYLSEINKDKKVLEYSLFQPGLFTNYLTNPYPTAKYLTQFQCQLDFEKKRAILLEESDDDVIVLTTVQDMAHVVARAVEYEGEWPVDGGMRGSRMTLKEIIALGEEIRGGPFAVERIPKDEMVKGTWNSSWLPVVNHPSIPLEYREAAAKGIVGGIMLAINSGAFDINDGWNKLLPDYKFTDAKEFLSREWEGKP